jgi:hypothetical protein
LASHHILIDFENVQPKNLELLTGHPFEVYVFCGANQTRVPIELASALQQLGSNGHYVRLSGNGRNALDFHIAWYLGTLCREHSDGTFHVISRDRGFDPLLAHLKNRNIEALRHEDLAEIPVLRMSKSVTDDEKIEAIVKNLRDRGQSRPRKVKTLVNTINTLFTKKLEEPELLSLVEELKRRGYLDVRDAKVSYSLPQ